MHYDYVVIGAGIVGLSTALQLKQRRSRANILVLEKEPGPARHQTGHNSGVVHSGIYYVPGSLKAAFCKAGFEATVRFCAEAGIPLQRCGKLLVATSDIELQRMQGLYARARANGIDVDLVDRGELSRLEPNVSGLGAILVRSTAVVDYQLVCTHMAARFTSAGGAIRYCAQVTALEETDSRIKVHTRSHEPIEASFLIACAGLQADRVARMSGIDTGFSVIPFRGEYYVLARRRNDIVRHLIYPIPDPELPFLGVHLTRTIGGEVTVGPNAVLGWKREGYGRINFDLRDCTDMLRFPGFWRVLRDNVRVGARELRNSLWKEGYLRAVQKYCPSICRQDLLPYRAGIRAQAVTRDGALVHDFLFLETARSVHVCNAPSPAATSAIPIGAYICDRAGARG